MKVRCRSWKSCSGCGHDTCSMIMEDLPLKIPLVSRDRYRPTNHALVFDAKAVFIAVGFLAAFALGIVLLVATSKPAHVNHSAPETYSTDAPPDNGIMGTKPAAGKTPER